MATTKQNIRDGSDLLTGEYNRYNQLILKESALTTTGFLSFNSPSNNLPPYNSNTGEAGLLDLLETALRDRLWFAEDANALLVPSESNIVNQSISVGQLGGVTYANSLQSGSQFVNNFIQGKTISNLAVNSKLTTTTGFTGIAGSLSISNGILITGDGSNAVTTISTNTNKSIRPSRKYGVICEIQAIDAPNIMAIDLVDGSSTRFTNTLFISNPTASQRIKVFRTMTAPASPTGTMSFRVLSEYADASTANGKRTALLDDVGLTIVELKSDEQSFTDAQFREAYDTVGIPDPGLNSVNGSLEVSGKNQFDNTQDNVGNSGGVTVKVLNTGIRVFNLSTGTNRYAGYRLLLPRGQAVTLGATRTIHVAGDSAGLIEARSANGTTLGSSLTGNVSFTVPDDNVVLLWFYSNNTSGVGDVSFTDIYLNIGTDTDYNDYIDSKVSLPTLGQWDSFNVETGKKKDGGVNSYSVKSAEFVSLDTTTSPNVDYVLFTKQSNDSNFGKSTGIDGTNTIVANNFREDNFTSASTGVGTLFNLNSTQYGVIVAKGTYGSLANAQADLGEGGTNPLVIAYQRGTVDVEDHDAMQATAQRGGVYRHTSASPPSISYKLALNPAEQRNQSSEGIVRLENETDRTATQALEPLSTTVVSQNITVDIPNESKQRFIIDVSSTVSGGNITINGVALYRNYALTSQLTALGAGIYVVYKRSDSAFFLAPISGARLDGTAVATDSTASPQTNQLISHTGQGVFVASSERGGANTALTLEIDGTIIIASYRGNRVDFPFSTGYRLLGATTGEVICCQHINVDGTSTILTANGSAIGANSVIASETGSGVIKRVELDQNAQLTVDGTVLVNVGSFVLQSDITYNTSFEYRSSNANAIIRYVRT